jgi:hypothetical protein
MGYAGAAAHIKLLETSIIYLSTIDTVKNLDV